MFDGKKCLMALVLTVGALASGAAQASRVNWAVSINGPAVSTVFSNGEVYFPAPVYYSPPPVYYAPPPRVVYRPPVVVYAPGPAVVVDSWGRHQHRHHRHHRHDHDRSDEYGDRYHQDRWGGRQHPGDRH